MDCINKCGNEAKGRSKYCSDSCKVAYNRNKRNTESVTDVTVSESVTNRTNNSDKVGHPDSWRDKIILEAVGIDKSRCLTISMLDSLPAGISKPTAQPTSETAGVHASELMDKMNNYHSIDWLDSPEYAEVIYRLLTSSIEQLEQEGQFIPGWKGAA